MKTSCLVALLLVAVPLIAFSQTMGARAVTIKIDGPAVIGFFPPVKQLGDNNPDDGVIEVTGQLSDALDNTGECRKKSGITAQVSFGDRINPCGERKTAPRADRAAEILGEGRRSVFVQTRCACAGDRTSKKTRAP